MLSEACELRVRTGAGEYPGIAFCEGTPTLALESTADDCCPAALIAGVDDLVNEVDKVIWEPNCNLLAHPIMVAKR